MTCGPGKCAGVHDSLIEAIGEDEDLERTNGKLKALAEALNSVAIVVETDAMGQITFVNDAFCKITNHRREELLGKHHREITNSGYHPAEFWKEMWHTISSGRTWRGEIKNHSKDGTHYWVDTAIAPLFGVDGEPETYLAIQFVITERKMAEDLQRAASAHARSLIEVMLDPLVTISSEGKITDVNEASIQATGVSREKLIGTDFSDYFTEREKAREGYERVFSEGSVKDYPLAIRHSSGLITDVLYHASVYKDDKGKVLGVIAAARDVTERKRDEESLEETNRIKLGDRNTSLRESLEKLRMAHEEILELNRNLERRVTERTAQLEATNLELKSFTYSVSHDLRAPLRHIQGYTEMLKGAANDQLSEKAQRYLKVITTVSVEMGQLIDDLLAFSRMSHETLHEAPCNLNALAQNCIRDLEMETRDRSIVWKISRLPRVCGDASMLKQVFANLIGNAVKYSRLRASAEIEIGSSGIDAGHAILFVRDNGAGFDMQYVHKLFGVFQRLHPADEFEGTGIGLATVQRIVARHGGRVWAEGVLDHGATIYFTLKLATDKSCN